MSCSVYLGRAPEGEQHLLLKYANRHGLIAGATGTGKTLTLQGMAEDFSNAGVPVFIADVKGDLAGLAQPGIPSPPLTARAVEIGFTLAPAACPVIFWDIFGVAGHPVRTTVSEMGPLLFSRLLSLNAVQEGVLNVAFAVADAEGLLLLDLDDLRALLSHLSENAKEYSARYGQVSASSVAAIQRGLLALENQGAQNLFGEPALRIEDFLRLAPDGRGAVNILSAERLMQSPGLYATFMLWLMSELFEDLPEAGDLDKPKLVFFFDEAHLLFNNAPKALLEKVEQLVRLIRSKGVGIFFITQNPADIPADVLGQLGNRVQHALRAFTPQDQKAVRAAAETFRANPAFDTKTAITQLGVGEALVSTLDAKGTPGVVARTLIRPPCSRTGSISPAERASVMGQSPVKGMYDQPVNRESAYEMLTARVNKPPRNPWGKVEEHEEEEQMVAAGASGRRASRSAGYGYSSDSPRPRGRQPESLGTALTKSVVRAAGSQIGRQLVRGLLQSLLKGK